MPFVPNLFSRLSPVTFKLPDARTVVIPGAAGVQLTVTRLLGSSSVFSLATGSSTNLSIDSNGAISAESEIPGASSQRAVVRESVGYRALEYPITFSNTNPAPVPVIKNVWLDSDMGPDTDDRDTFFLIGDAHKRGVINLIGVSSSTNEGSTGAGLREWVKFYGLPTTTLIGVNKDTNDRTSTSFIQAYRARFAADETTNANVDAGYIALRKGLAQTAGKITLLTIGGADNIEDLLKSPADEISALTGLELVAQKCERYICMLGDYSQTTGNGNGEEFNVALNRNAAVYVSENWPTTVPMDWIGTTWGDVIHNSPNGKAVGDDWRNAAAMSFTPGPNKSFDLGTFYEVTGQTIDLNWTEKGGTKGKMTINPSNGILTWSTTVNRNHSWYRWKANVDRSETGPVAAKINADLAALVPANTFTLPTPLIEMDFVNKTYTGAAITDIVCSGAAGRTALNADGSTVTFGANQLRLTDQGLFLDANGSDTMRFAGPLLAAVPQNMERSVLIIVNKNTPGGRLLGATTGYIFGSGGNDITSWSGSFGGNGNLPTVLLPTGRTWSERLKIVNSWTATSRRLFLAGQASEIVGKGMGSTANVYVGHNANGGERWNGFIEKIIVYDKAMPYTNGVALST